MTTHYRRLTTGEIAALQGELEAGTEYDTLASFGGVRVGTSGGAAIVHVLDPDRPGLPGAFEAETIGAMHPAVRRNVYRARWEPTSDDDPGYGTEAEVPDGAVLLEAGIIPHVFAGG